jgi:hypothetical protein
MSANVGARWLWRMSLFVTCYDVFC